MIVIDYHQLRNSLVLSISSLAFLLCSILGTNYNLLWWCHFHPYLIIVISWFNCWDWSARLHQNQWGLKPWSMTPRVDGVALFCFLCNCRIFPWPHTSLWSVQGYFLIFFIFSVLLFSFWMWHHNMDSQRKP